MITWLNQRLNHAHPTNLLLMSYFTAIGIGTLALMLEGPRRGPAAAG